MSTLPSEHPSLPLLDHLARLPRLRGTWDRPHPIERLREEQARLGIDGPDPVRVLATAAITLLVVALVVGLTVGSAVAWVVAGAESLVATG